jgi:hypothetical protein
MAYSVVRERESEPDLRMDARVLPVAMKGATVTHDTTPHVVWSGSFRVFGVTVKCHTLSNGQRIIEAESFHNLIEAMGAPGETIEGDMKEFAKWQTG